MKNKLRFTWMVLKNYRVLLFIIILISTPLFSETVFALVEPPTNLTANTMPAQKIRLEWDEPSTHVDGYQIERESPVGGGWSILISDTGNDKPFYTDTGLALDTVYNYRVSSISETEISLPSNNASANTSDAGILKEPTPPRSLNAIGGNNRVALSWTEPNPRGSPITDYIIEFSSNGGISWQVMGDGQNTKTSLIVKGLFPDHYYVFRVYAVNDIGTSNFSEIIERTQNAEKDDETLPQFTGLEIISNNETDYKLYQLDYKHETLPQKTLQLGQEIKIRVRIDDKEATSNILHFGMYMDIRDRTSQISKSQAYLIYEKGKGPSIVDLKGLFEHATITPVFEGRSMWMEVDLIFKKPMSVSDIILETWNEGRHPIYFTIPNSLEIKPDVSYDSKDEISVQEQTTKIQTENAQTIQESNISGTVFIPDTLSKDPIVVYSTAGGKKTQIKNNQDLKIENQDLSVEISGYYEDGMRGQWIILTIFHPDETTQVKKIVLNSKNHYSVPAKLYNKWQNGIYQIVAKTQIGNNGNDYEIFGKIQFFVNDGKNASFGGIFPVSENIIKTKLAYLDENISEENLRQVLLSEGIPQDKIDKFIVNNPRPISNLFYYVIFILVGLLFALTIALGPKRHYG